jgi:hypothetical protein
MYEFKNEFSEEVINISAFYDRMLLKEGKSLSHELKVRCAIDGKVRYFLVPKVTYSSISGNMT